MLNRGGAVYYNRYRGAPAGGPPRGTVFLKSESSVHMALQYTNRRGRVYHIQSHDRKGKIAYTATRKPTGHIIDQLPEGYEIHERPEDGQLFVRKIVASPISPRERELVEAAARETAKLKYFIVRIEDARLVVYLPTRDPEAGVNIMRYFVSMTDEQAQEEAKSTLQWSLGCLRYAKLLRFRLTDPEKRHFAADRWGFDGDVADWNALDVDKPLATLLKKHMRDIGPHSFYDLV